jgi:purine-nucleoside phosphorylase
MTDTSISAIDAFPDAVARADRLRDALGVDVADVAVVCGSGFSAVAPALGLTRHAPMADVGLPAPHVAGHGGDVWAGELAGRRVIVLAGRVHLYEGRTVGDVVAAVRAVAALGCTSLVVTNAAGSLRPETPPGQVVVISDHLNLTGTNPLTALPGGAGSGFVDMSAAYDPAWRQRLGEARGGDLPDGVYAALAGPSYETPAEIRMLRAVGADLVGMSTVCEVIAARHAGMSVLGASLVTNLAAGLAGQLDHSEVTRTGAESLDHVVEIITAAVSTAAVPTA